MNLCDFMVCEAVVSDLKAQTRDESIRELVESLAACGRLDKTNVDEIIQLLVERENQGSTGIGKGIAVPHIKHASVSDLVGTVGCSKKGIDFSSLDDAPVYSVMLLISPPNNPDRHLEAMESLFAHLQRDLFRKFLRQADDKQAVVELLEEADASTEESGL